MKNTCYLPLALLIIISFSSCLRPRLKVEMKSISRFTWKIVYSAGKKIDKDLYPNGLPFVNFKEDGIITGESGCNGFGGKINLEESDIVISDIQMDAKSCGDPYNDIESGIIQGLESSNQLFLEGNTLIFMKDDKVLLRLKDN
jgi:heat shock protein HslJ